MPVSRLTLTDFRSYESASLEVSDGFVLLFGENGAGKTNLLEAVSMLAPGRGLRAVPLSDMARKGGSGAWAVAAKLGDADVGTGTLAAAPERRQVRINAVPASVNSLSDWLSVLWLTPAMDRLFTGSAGERRRFLDRLVLALEPSHAHHSSRYEAAMRARNKLLGDEGWDEGWLASLEAAIGILLGIALLVSGIGSYVVLNRQREALARRVQTRAEAMTSRIEEMKAKEDVDDEPPSSSPDR